jgi:hypothetical protein
MIVQLQVCFFFVIGSSTQNKSSLFGLRCFPHPASFPVRPLAILRKPLILARPSPTPIPVSFLVRQPAVLHGPRSRRSLRPPPIPASFLVRPLPAVWATMDRTLGLDAGRGGGPRPVLLLVGIHVPPSGHVSLGPLLSPHPPPAK